MYANSHPEYYCQNSRKPPEAIRLFVYWHLSAFSARRRVVMHPLFKIICLC